MTTWQTSGHNGDPYGEETRPLDPVAAKQELLHLRSGLQARAVAAEKELQKKLADKRADDAALAAVKRRMGNI